MPASAAEKKQRKKNKFKIKKEIKFFIDLKQQNFSYFAKFTRIGAAKIFD